MAHLSIDGEHTAWRRRQFRAPLETGGLLVEPSDHTPLHLMTANRQLLDGASTLIGKETLAELRRVCRRDVLRNACEYTSRLRGIRPEMPSIDDDLVVVGHQPGLFHPGVWLKHWAASAIARHAGGIALNVIIDNDLCDNLSVTVPKGSEAGAGTDRIELDRSFSARPWEDVRLRDPETFRSAGDRLCHDMQAWGFQPVACAAWADIGNLEVNDSAVDHLTRLRHRQQQANGCEILEVPMRNVARLPAFAQFVAHVVQNIASLSAVYNEGLSVYRKLNKLRSDSHPMPNLAQRGDLFEAPFWIWRAGDQERRPLWIKPDGCGVRLFDLADGGDAQLVAVVRQENCGWDAWHRMLTDLDHQGFRVRPRALMTTLFLRLCLADLFIHGIGGAKYDEVTDWIIRQFIGMKPPEFLTVSGTFRLPLPRTAVTSETVRELERKKRDMKFNPDRHGASGPLVDEKQSLIAEQREAANRNGTPRTNRARYRRLREINQELFLQIELAYERVQKSFLEADAALKANRIANGREYSWVLFEEQQLIRELNSASHRVATGTHDSLNR